MSNTNILMIIIAFIAVIAIVIGVVVWQFLKRTKPMRDFAKQAKEAQKELEAETALKEAKERRRKELSEQEGNSIVVALGGRDNIIEARQCAIRIRVRLNDYDKADEKMLKHSGVSGIVKTGKSWQLIVGDRALEVFEAMQIEK